MATEQERADLSIKRGEAAKYITDPKAKKDFIATQENEEAKGSSGKSLAELNRQADDTTATQGENIKNNVKTPSYKDGIDRVPKTGLAVLHKDEKVLNKEDAAVSRGEKGKNMHDSMSALAGALGGHGDKKEEKHKSKKELKEIRIRKAKNGGHIIEHHHTDPVEHPMEENTTTGDQEMGQHMADHMGDGSAMTAAAPDAGAAGAPPAAGAAPMAGMAA
jgi:hypothetical protein